MALITLKGLYPFLGNIKNPPSPPADTPKTKFPSIEIPAGLRRSDENLLKFLESSDLPFDPFDGQVKLVFQDEVSLGVRGSRGSSPDKVFKKNMLRHDDKLAYYTSAHSSHCYYFTPLQLVLLEKIEQTAPPGTKKKKPANQIAAELLTKFHPNAWESSQAELRSNPDVFLGNRNSSLKNITKIFSVEDRERIQMAFDEKRSIRIYTGHQGNRNDHNSYAIECFATTEQFKVWLVSRTPSGKGTVWDVISPTTATFRRKGI